MRRTVLVFTLALAVGSWSSLGVAAAPDDGPNRTHRLHGAATATPRIVGTCPAGPPSTPPVVAPITITVDGEGVFSRLGRTNLTIDETGLGICIGAPVPVPIAVLTAITTYTAANGDQLVAESVASTPIEPVPGTSLFAFSSTDELLPTGTGRFAGASGTVQVDVTFDPSVSPIVARFTVDGEITLTN